MDLSVVVFTVLEQRAYFKLIKRGENFVIASCIM